MKYLIIFILLAIVSVTIFAKTGDLKEGTKVKNFKVKSSSGATVDFDTFKGHFTILYFYPKDDTSGCTKEALTFSSMVKEFKKLNTVVYGINKDDLESHKKFIKKNNLKIELLYDENGEVSKFFDVRTLFGMCGRDTILINPEGNIEKIYRGVNPEGNPKDILEYIKNRK